MGTTLVEVNDLFLSLVNDYQLNALYNSSVANFNIMLEAWLLYSINEFKDICTQTLTYNTTTQAFTETLTMEHKLILAQIMTKYWLQKEVQNVLQMRNLIQDKDFKTYSAAQNLMAKQALLTSKKEEIDKILSDYELKNNDWDNWDSQLFRV